MSEPAKRLAEIISSGEWALEEIREAHVALLKKGDMNAAAALAAAAAELNIILL